MSGNTVHVRATRDKLRQVLSQLPAESQKSAAVLTRVGIAALGHIKRAFIVKARGGMDEAGDKWQPLSPKTIAYSRRGGRTRAEKKRAARPSSALTTKQQTRWWTLYRQGLAMYKGDKGHAARRAWFILKSEGAVTLLDKYGHRQVEILRDTGLLLNSLSPGYGGGEQVFRVGSGEVVVGTNRKGAAQHHTGVPGRLPQRRLWPSVDRWPLNWWIDIVEQARAGILDIATSLIKGA